MVDKARQPKPEQPEAAEVEPPTPVGEAELDKVTGGYWKHPFHAGLGSEDQGSGSPP